MLTASAPRFTASPTTTMSLAPCSKPLQDGSPAVIAGQVVSGMLGSSLCGGASTLTLPRRQTVVSALSHTSWHAGSVKPMALFTYDVSTEHVNTPLPSSREQLMQEQQPDLVTYSMQVRPNPLPVLW